MLNIYSLNNVRDQKEINKLEIYKKVLKKCHHRIKTFSSKGDSFCFYIVPEYIYGIPKYDTLNCAAYIVNKLKKNGFHVSYTYPNLIFISWGHIPSEIKNPQIKDLDIKSLTNKSINNNSLIKDQTNNIEYRYIEDYNPSKNFMNKLNQNKRIKY